jgi:RHS repeat-associated protein
MQTRTYGGTTYTLSYDAENRLTAVSGGATATFVYDGDGNRVKGTVGTSTTYYVGDYFEWTGSTSTMKKYYYAGGVRMAMRTGSSNPLWLLGDHLGSTSKVANFDGLSVHSQQLYKPWGEGRYTSGTLPTTYKFTGQREEASLGLYFYNARYYDPALGRFVQADTVVPNSGDVVAWDRYAYSSGNPVKYIDPDGHKPIPPVHYSGNRNDEDSTPSNYDWAGGQILWRYLTGGEDWYIDDDPIWSNYMSQNSLLSSDLSSRAIGNAQEMIQNDISSLDLSESYAMEIENGEGVVGYQYLHGTNSTVGGFQREGNATMVQNSSGGFDVTFNMSYTWNDNIDPNPIYTTDVVKSRFAEIITFGKADPYSIHITWTDTFVLHFDSNEDLIP